MPEQLRTRHSASRAASHIALIYCLVAALWILFSDRAVEAAFSDQASIARAGLLKGWLFVAVTTSLLYILVRRLLARLQAANAEQNRLQNERLRALQLFESISECSDDAIFAKDLRGRYLLINRAACKYIGKQPIDIIGQDDTASFPAEQAALLLATGQEIIASGRTVTSEEYLTTASGERVFHSTKGPLLDAAGNTIGIFGIARDITAHKQDELELRRSIEELAQFNSAAIGREVQMIALKRQINELSRQLGQAAPYDLAAFDAIEQEQP